MFLLCRVVNDCVAAAFSRVYMGESHLIRAEADRLKKMGKVMMLAKAWKEGTLKMVLKGCLEIICKFNVLDCLCPF